VVEIDKIIVSESKSSKNPDESSSTTITIQETKPKFKSAADLIDQVAGVHIQHYGGSESSTAVSIRGSNSNQVNIFLDGVPLETSSGEGIGLGDLSSSGLRKIQVYKSQAPSEFGFTSMGPVISLSSLQAEKGLKQHYGLAYGSFQTWDVSTQIGYGGENYHLMGGLKYGRTKGSFSFLDNNGTPLNASDDSQVSRQNNHKSTLHPYIKWQYDFDQDYHLELTQHFFRIDSGVPGLQSFQSQTASRDLTEWMSHVKLSRENIFTDKMSYENTVFWRVVKSQFSDPNGEIGLGAAQDNDNLTVLFGDRFHLVSNIHKRFKLTQTAAYTFESFSPKDYLAASPIGSTSHRHQIDLGLEANWSLHDDLLISLQGQSIHAFYRINDNDPSLLAAGSFQSGRAEHPFAGSVLARYYLPMDFIFKASLGRRVRLPKFHELFGDQGYVLGNAQLTSEKSLHYDAGLNWQRKFKSWMRKIRAEVNYFASHHTDLIQFELTSGVARASNLGKAKIWGVESLLSFEFLEYITLIQNYTYQNAVDKAVNNGNYLVGRPEHEWNTTLNFDYKGFDAAFHTSLIDNKYLDSLNTQRVNSRLRFDAEIGYLIKDHYRISFEAKNITNSQIVDAVGFPLPGRSFFGRVDVIY
jgi:outer membrane cobalamin receptor